MSADASTCTDDEPCAVCGERSESVTQRHLAPVGNFVEIAVCDGCVEDWGTVAPESEIGPQPGLTADGLCLLCSAEEQADSEPVQSLELEFPIGGMQGYISGGLCEKHAKSLARTILVDGGSAE